MCIRDSHIPFFGGVEMRCYASLDPVSYTHLDVYKRQALTAVAASRLLGSPENANWQEMAMVMNAFDTNFDGGNEVYACNLSLIHI